jgi:hypothetical protein
LPTAGGGGPVNLVLLGITTLAGDIVKLVLLGIITVLLAANASAADCVAEKPESYKEMAYAFENCVARIDDVIRTSVDEYAALQYIVQYRGQRLVVFDPLARSDRAIGDQVSFTVMKLDMPANSRSKGYRALIAQTTFDLRRSSEKSPP